MAGSTAHGVCACTAIQTIASVAAIQRVVAAAAEQHVIAVKAGNGVVPTQSVQRVCPRRADDDVVAFARVAHQSPNRGGVPEHAIVELDRTDTTRQVPGCGTGPMVGHGQRIAGAIDAQDQRDTRPRQRHFARQHACVQQHPARGGINHGIRHGDGVLEVIPAEHVGTRARHRQSSIGIRSGPTIQRVVTAKGNQHVTFTASDQGIGVRNARSRRLVLHCVDADTAIQDVVADIAGDDVACVSARTIDVCGAGQGQVLDVIRRHVRNRRTHFVGTFHREFRHQIAGVVHHIGVIARSTDENVGSRAAIQTVVAVTAGQRVIAGLPGEGVIAESTQHRVIAGTRLDVVVTCQRIDVVETCRSHDHIIAGRALADRRHGQRGRGVQRAIGEANLVDGSGREIVRNRQDLRRCAEAHDQRIDDAREQHLSGWQRCIEFQSIDTRGLIAVVDDVAA